MPIRLRMAMHGHAHKKTFHIVAINSKLARNAKPAELLGIYDPHSADDKNPRVVRWSVDRIRYWLSVGAIPSKPVAKLLQLVRFQSFALLFFFWEVLTPNRPFIGTNTQTRFTL